MLPAARTQPIAATTIDLLVVGGASLLRGWSFVEPTGSAAASIELYDGTGVDGAYIVGITLDPGESTRDWLADGGIGCLVGLYLHVVSGEVQGATWVSPAILLDGFAIAEGVRPVWSGSE